MAYDEDTVILGQVEQNKGLLQFPRMGPRKVDLSLLINRLNYLNFRGEPVLFQLRHRRHDNIIVKSAIPQPCRDDELECLWVDGDEADDGRLRAYAVVSLIINDGQRLTQVKPELISMDGRRVTVRLPKECCEAQSRAIKRFRCSDISVSVVCNSAVYRGCLVDFNAFYFRVELKAIPPQTFDWVSSQVPLSVTLNNSSGDVIYIGDCRIARQGVGEEARDYVLEPIRSMCPRFRAKEFRSERREFLPKLNVVFVHPVTQKKMNLKMADLSGTGFSLTEHHEEATLLPGMVLRDVGIQLTNRSKLTCTVQVVHRILHGNSPMVHVGLAILDINTQQHMELVSMLHQAKDPDTYVSAQVDPEVLWDLFFETGFIYPEKYVSLAHNKDAFKENYTRLYTDHPTIARHFVHMEYGKVLGHFSMLRLFEKTWFNHHHAAVHHQRKSGLLVLDRMSEYINDTHRMFSSHIRYNGGFYRADNRFPVKFFGGFAEKMKNPKVCHVDNFGYLSYEAVPAHSDWGSDGRLELAKARAADLEDLQGFYEKVSNGLLLDAFDLTPEALLNNTLDEEYRKAGFNREIHRLAVKKNGELKAVILVNRTDIGLNFSELTNATKIFVVDSSGFKKNEFHVIMMLIAMKFNLVRFPLLVYPLSYLDAACIPYEKVYSCNIMSLYYWDEYMRYMREFMKKAKVH
jgi:hypothetical protein